MRIQYLAFRNPNGIGLFLSPNPVPSDEYVAHSSQRRRKTILENPHARFMKVVDAASGKMIACGHWDIYPAERTQDQVDKLTHRSPPPADANADAWNDFFGYMSEQRNSVLGNRPIALLHTLVTHLDHRRRGAGGMLMERFVADIDAEQLEGYVEASQAGRPLYAKFGFEPVFEKEFPLEKYGGSGIDWNTVMVRRPRLSKSI
jgi:GNAT superfamily N-acetyltransferase